MDTQHSPEQASLVELLNQLSAKVDMLEKEVKATRKIAKKTHKTVKSIYKHMDITDKEEETD